MADSLKLLSDLCVQVPFLRGDPALHAFLSQSNEKDWEKARSDPDYSKDMFHDTSVGAVKVDVRLRGQGSAPG